MKAFRVTGHEAEKRLFDGLGIAPDWDSFPHLCEWYWTMSEKDFLAVNELAMQGGLILRASEWNAIERKVI